MTRDISTPGVSIRVLVSRTYAPSCYAAIALDMDLWGIGKSLAAACDDLSANMKTLISLALQFKCIHMIEHAAPDEYLEKYYARRYSRLSCEMVNERVASIAYPDIDFDAFVKCVDHPIIPSLEDIDSRLCLYRHRNHDQTRILYHPDVNGCQTAYPLRLHSGTAPMHPGHLSSLSRRFAIPNEKLKRLPRESPGD